MSKIIYKILNIVTTLYTLIIFYIGGFAVHIYTAYAINLSYGLFFGVIAFFCPVISEIIMFILYLIFYGLFNEYCIIIMIYLLCSALSFVLAYVTEYFESKVTYNKKYIELSNIVMKSLNIYTIEEALAKTCEFYKDNGVDLSNINLDANNKYKVLSNIVMTAIDTDNIDDAINKTISFYKEQGIEV